MIRFTFLFDYITAYLYAEEMPSNPKFAFVYLVKKCKRFYNIIKGARRWDLIAIEYIDNVKFWEFPEFNHINPYEIETSSYSVKKDTDYQYVLTTSTYDIFYFEKSNSSPIYWNFRRYNN